jgi:hypothetical protein
MDSFLLCSEIFRDFAQTSFSIYNYIEQFGLQLLPPFADVTALYFTAHGKYTADAF